MNIKFIDQRPGPNKGVVMPMQYFPLINQIKTPADLKHWDVHQLARLAEETRQFIIQAVSQTGGHLGASLGVVDLTIALHYMFDSPRDKIIWDVGHQCYAHKILTGRHPHFHSLRQYKGISGFPKITESEHDIYGTGHASTSISAALGMAKVRDLNKETHEVIAVIGDGSMTGGNALEAVNQAGHLDTKIIVILNDNRMSISENVGALSRYTHRIESTDIYKHVRDTINQLIVQGNGLRDQLMEFKHYLKEVGSPGLLFEKLGFNYVGPVDGHDIPDMLAALEQARKFNGPSLVHLRTIKGKGYSFAEENKPKYHGVNPFNIHNGQGIARYDTKTYTEIFSDTLIRLAREDHSIVAVTAAMPDGTGLSRFQEHFPQRFFDVGIAEQHAVVFAAGMARAGLKPVCAIYSTFLQRAYDAIIHDVCLQNLPVVFAVDRAGLVGNDGPTHHGAFDISFLSHIPNLVVMSPKDENEMQDMLFTAFQLNRPVAVRYPRGRCRRVPISDFQKLDMGVAEIMSQGHDLTLISVGTVFHEVEQAAAVLKSRGVSPTLINARFVKPLDRRLVDGIRHTGKAVIVEENVIRGGFGSAVLEACHAQKVKADIKLIGIPDRFIEQGSPAQLRKDCGLDAENITQAAMNLLDRPSGEYHPDASFFTQVSGQDV